MGSFFAVVHCAVPARAVSIQPRLVTLSETSTLTLKMSETPHIDIDYVANLARLDLSDAEKSKLGTQLDDILGYFDKLNAVDVAGVEPMAHAHRVFNVWREGDEPGPTYAPEVLLNMAPEQRDNQVVVPKVVE